MFVFAVDGNLESMRLRNEVTSLAESKPSAYVMQIHKCSVSNTNDSLHLIIVNNLRFR
jgi:hypothetical protein